MGILAISPTCLAGQTPSLGTTDQHLIVFCCWITDHGRQIMEGEAILSPIPCPGVNNLKLFPRC